LMLTLFSGIGSALAQKVLVSAPLPAAHKLVCACTNLRSVPTDILMTFNSENTSSSYTFTLRPGSTSKYEMGYQLAPDTVGHANCMVRRVDGKAALTRHLACTLSSVDANLGVNAVEPVNKKFNLVE
jgi:hypothetical protein